MATCRNCGANVGCGCQLTNGLCVNCISKGIKRFINYAKLFYKRVQGL